MTLGPNGTWSVPPLAHGSALPSRPPAERPHPPPSCCSCRNSVSPSSRPPGGRGAARRTVAVAGRGWRRKRRPRCNGADTGMEHARRRKPCPLPPGHASTRRLIALLPRRVSKKEHPSGVCVPRHPVKRHAWSTASPNEKAFCRRLLREFRHGLSRVRGNSHARFLGEGRPAMAAPYPTATTGSNTRFPSCALRTSRVPRPYKRTRVTTFSRSAGRSCSSGVRRESRRAFLQAR